MTRLATLRLPQTWRSQPRRLRTVRRERTDERHRVDPHHHQHRPHRAPATDNVGVAGYGVYNGGELVSTTAGTSGIVSGLTCGTNYTLAVDAFDGSGNSSAKSTAVMVSTLPCTDTSASDGCCDGADERRNGERHDQRGRQTATDAVGVTRVEFLRDGTVLGQDTTSPYSMSVNTTTVTNGSHTFRGPRL